MHSGSTVSTPYKHLYILRLTLYISDYQNTQGIIYLVDSADVERIPEAREEMNAVLSSDELSGAPLLVLANKQDLPGALNAAALTDKLGLNALRSRPWYIQACCAPSGDGLYEGLDWLTQAIKSRG